MKTAGTAALLGLTVVLLASCGKPAPANAPTNAAAATPSGAIPAGGPATAPPTGGGLGMAPPTGGGLGTGPPPGGGLAMGPGSSGGPGPGASASGGTRYDAIAVDDDVGSRGGNAGYGVGTGPTQDAAQGGAIAACQKAGNTNCQIRLTYTTCGAYASSRTKYGTGEGDTEAQARSAALDSCGNAGCQLTVSDCVGQ